MRGLGARTWAAVAALAAGVALVTACGGDQSSGLATLAGTATTAPAVDPAEIEPVSEPTAVTQAVAETAEANGSASTAEAGDGADETDGAATAAEPDGAGVEGSAESEDAAGAVSADAEGSAGSEETNGAVSAESDDTSDMTDEESLLAFAECMRDHGVDFPDPVVEADGTVTFGFRPGGGGEGGLAALREIGRNPNLPAARDACSGLLEGLAFGPGQGGFDLVEIQDTLLEFAQCMRDNGVDMGDPDLRDFIPGGDDDGQPGRPFGGIDFSDPDLLTAFQTCQQQVSLPTPRFGGGG